MRVSILRWSTLGTLALVLLSVANTPRQSAQAQSPPLSAESQISLVTILPGDPVYTFAGHSAFRIHDPVHNIDRLYNYGTFDFSDPLFIPKFTYGHLRYFLSVTSYAPTLRAYKRQGRPVIEQQLNLTRAQRNALYQFLQTNAQPNNRFYQYDFFFDNCSTRIRDALEETLNSRVDFSDAPAPNTSFRRLLDPYVASRPLMDLGFDLGLGLPADQIATAREAMFLPEHLMHAFDAATIEADGNVRPLVTETDTVQWVDQYRGMEPPLDWPVLVSILFLITVLGWTSWQAVSERAPTGWGDAVLFCIVGCAGLVICYLWFISTYAVTDNNLNLLWAWPTHLIAATFFVKRPESRRLQIYLAATAAMSVILMIGWPFWPQNFHTAILPFTLAIGIRAGWWALLPAQPTSLPSPGTSGPTGTR